LARHSPEFSQHGCQFRLDLLQPGAAQFVGHSIRMAVVLRPIAGAESLSKNLTNDAEDTLKALGE